MLAKKNRLPRSLFDTVRLKGRVFSYGNINIKVINQKTGKRFSVVVPKKGLKNNVERNRIRRQIYGFIELDMDNIKPVAVIIFIKNNKEKLIQNFQQEIKNLFKKAGLYQ